jgi:hypothetical protein
MRHEKIEAALKAELGRIDMKLKEAQNLHSAAWIGTGLAMGLFLATMTSHVPLVIAMAAVGALLNLATTRIVSRKK